MEFSSSVPYLTEIKENQSVPKHRYSLPLYAISLTEMLTNMEKQNARNKFERKDYIYFNSFKGSSYLTLILTLTQVVYIS